MSRVGGPNDVGAMNVSVGIDQAAVDASIAQTQAKLDAFAAKNAKNVVGPGIGPGGTSVDVNGRPMPYGPSIGPSVIGPGMENVTQEAGKATDKLDEMGNAGKSALSGIGESLRNQVAPWRNFYLGVSQAASSLFGIIGVAGTAAAAIALVGEAGRKAGEQIFNTAEGLQDLGNALKEMERITGAGRSIMSERLDRRLLQAGIRPQARERILSEAATAESMVTQAQGDLEKAQGAGPSFFGAIGDQLPYLGGPIGIAASWLFGNPFESDRTRNIRLGRRQLGIAQTRQQNINEEVEDIVGGSMQTAPGSARGNGISTDAGLGSAVRTFTVTNDRSIRIEEEARRREFGERQVEAARRRNY
jgi:hypothetical protein